MNDSHGQPRVVIVGGGFAGLFAARRLGRAPVQVTLIDRAEGHAYDKPFRYRDLGSAAYISRGRAVISAFGLHFGGFLGWVGWLFIHIGFLTGIRNRIGAVFSWWFAFTRDIRRERTFTIDDMPLPSGAYGDTGEPGHPADNTV